MAAPPITTVASELELAAAALFGPIIAVVVGGAGTLVVGANVAVTWPALGRIGPLYALRAPEAEAEPTSPSAKPAQP